MHKKMYSNEKNSQILIALLKKHNIRTVIASPGTTNINFVASLQHDKYFQIFSSVDERSAAYMACGMAAETLEPVVLSCTGATASRNYVPALTEAFYRKLPILAVTSTQHIGNIGQLIPQVIDRSQTLKDIVKISVTIPTIHDNQDYKAAEIAINEALLELRHKGGGPVHINLVTTYDKDFSTERLPDIRFIKRITSREELPTITQKKVGIFVGNHKKWDAKLTTLVENFCKQYNAVVLCDHTSNYQGKFRIFPGIVCGQNLYSAECNNFDLLIHIGEVSGAYYGLSTKEVWRINLDGKIADAFGKLTYVFEMSEEDFFSGYASNCSGVTLSSNSNFYTTWKNEVDRLIHKIPDLPFSNIWIAQHTIDKLPDNSVLHLGILNSLRSWNFFEGKSSLLGYSNTGGFGIDGGLSSCVGASVIGKEKLYFIVLGDLAFFYDMNVLGNRHLPPNIRILLVNNGCGTEFKNFNHMAAMFGENADDYIAAKGHFGQRSSELVKHYAEDLGFDYMSASSKEEYLQQLEHFLSSESLNQPILFEVFTDSTNESDALRKILHLDISPEGTVKAAAKKLLGQKNVSKIKHILRK